MLLPNQTIGLNHFVLCYSPEVSYVGIAYSKEFPAEEIQFRLNEKMEPLKDSVMGKSDVSLFFIE